MDENPELIGSTIALMSGVALLFDVISAIPLIGNLLGILAGLTFYLWFKKYGIHFNTPTRAITMIVTFIIEALPVVSALPAWTALVLITILSHKAEEKLNMVK